MAERAIAELEAESESLDQQIRDTRLRAESARSANERAAAAGNREEARKQDQRFEAEQANLATLVSRYRDIRSSLEKTKTEYMIELVAQMSPEQKKELLDMLK